MEHHEAPQFGPVKSVLYSLILIGLVLGGAELAVRTWAHYLRAEVERFDPGTGTFVLVPGRHRTRFGTAVINSQGFVGAELEPEGPDLWRIVAVGDSCTFGGGNERHTYPALLDRRLDRRERPGLRYEVVNAGISGLNSELALRRLESVVPPLHPDVVTIYIGWNDLMKFDPVAQGKEARFSGVARVLDQLWLARGLRKLLFFYVRPAILKPRTGPESRSGRFQGFRPTYFEENLERMVTAARGIGASVLLATLPTVVRPWMTLEDLEQARVVFPYFPSAYGVGDLLDLVGAYNRAIERVGLKTGTPVVDLAARFAAIEDPRPYFHDTMHTNLDGMAVIAEAFEEALEAHGLLEPAPAAGTRRAAEAP